MRRSLCVLCAATGLALAGCGSSHHEAQPVGKADVAHSRWLHEIRARADLAPTLHFNNYSRHQLFARLELLGVRRGFTVDKVRMIHLSPGQSAPDVEISTPTPQRISRAMPTIISFVDPIYRRTLPGGAHTLWEGFFFQVNDESGSPAFGVYSARRGKHAEGGQFARSDALLPYVHG